MSKEALDQVKEVEGLDDRIMLIAGKHCHFRATDKDQEQAMQIVLDQLRVFYEERRNETVVVLRPIVEQHTSTGFDQERQVFWYQTTLVFA